jgi:arsenate reductase
MVQVAFVCIENAGRSQMAAAFARRRGVKGVEILCGGTRPAAQVHPTVVAAMREVGIDLSREVPRAITLGCASSDVCPAGFRGDAVDWALPDPAGKSIEEVRRIRDEIERRVATLLEEVAHGG